MYSCIALRKIFDVCAYVVLTMSAYRTSKTCFFVHLYDIYAYAVYQTISLSTKPSRRMQRFESLRVLRTSSVALRTYVGTLQIGLDGWHSRKLLRRH